MIKSNLLMLCMIMGGCTAPAPRPDSFHAYIAKWEGCIHTPSHDTVGIGHKGAHGLYYTDADIERLYSQDYAVALRACRYCVRGFDSLPRDARWVALSLAWSVGPTGLSRFAHFCAALSEHRYDDAATELLNSKWAEQVQLDRLRDHRARLYQLYLHGLAQHTLHQIKAS